MKKFILFVLEFLEIAVLMAAGAIAWTHQVSIGFILIMIAIGIIAGILDILKEIMKEKIRYA